MGSKGVHIMIDWKRKLTSRKFWMAVIGLISGILLAFKFDAETVETISGVVLAFGSVVAYIIGEGLTDAANGTQVIVDDTEGEDNEGGALG